jgi:hypothetical protein
MSDQNRNSTPHGNRPDTQKPQPVPTTPQTTQDTFVGMDSNPTQSPYAQRNYQLPKMGDGMPVKPSNQK